MRDRPAQAFTKLLGLLVQRASRRLDHERQLLPQLVELRADDLDQPAGERIVGAHPRQHLVHDPAVDPGQQVFRPPMHERLHQHERRTQEKRQQRAVKRDLQGRRHARQVGQETVEVLHHRQHLADIHQGARDALDRADKPNHRQEDRECTGSA